MHTQGMIFSEVNMGRTERVTVTLPVEMLQEIDRCETNRSRFVLEAVQREVERRRREKLLLSLENPHGESIEMEAIGLSEWGEESGLLLDSAAGTPIRWSPGKGWETP